MDNVGAWKNGYNKGWNDAIEEALKWVRAQKSFNSLSLNSRKSHIYRIRRKVKSLKGQG